jgi:hypothetical protein
MRLAGTHDAPKLRAMRHILSLCALLLLTACNSLPGKTFADTLETRDWREIATADDRERLRDWRATFEQGLREAREAGFGAQVKALGALADPDTALPFAAAPNGQYRCRIIKLGSPRGGLAYVDYPAFECRIRAERDLQGLAKLTGSQRPIGLLFPDDELRQVFLGTLVLGDETRAMRYGADPERDMIGALQQHAPGRWRLLLPRPRFESTLDLIELVPVGEN